MGPVSYASAPTALSLLTEWRPDYVVALLLVLTAAAYIRMRRILFRSHLSWSDIGTSSSQRDRRLCCGPTTGFRRPADFN